MSPWGRLIDVGSVIGSDTLPRLLPPHRRGLVAGGEGVIVDRWQIDSHRALWLIGLESQTLVVPVIEDDYPRRADVGDLFLNQIPGGRHGRFASTVVFSAPVVSETRIGADQTNESLVLDERWVAKWQLSLGHHRVLTKERHLRAKGFPHTPAGCGEITWRSDSGEELLLVSVKSYLKNSSDGWTWCVEYARKDVRLPWPAEVARVVAGMHGSFAGTPLAHGDLHVGQLLLSHGSYYVIDFDGNPLGNQEESWLRDVVSMLCSFVHVAAVAEVKYRALHDMVSWVDDVSRQFLDTYSAIRGDVTLPDQKTLWGLMAENEVVEMEYADRFLPEWAYAARYGQAFIERKLHEAA